MPARPITTTLGLLLLALTLVGCSGDLLPRKEAPPGIYLIEARTEAARSNPTGPSLAVSPVRAAAGFETSDMIYVEQAHKLQAFAHHRWADSPARMLEPLLVSVAEQSGLFSTVSEPGSHTRAELRLEAKLLRLQQVFDPKGSQLELALRVSLVDSGRGRILASQVMQTTVVTREATPYGGVMAANLATEHVLGELQAFLTRALKQR